MKLIFRHTFLLLFLLLAQNQTLLAQKGMKFSKLKKAEKSQLAEYAFSEGMKKYILGDFSQALAHFEEAKKLGGENAALNYMMGKIFFLREKPDISLQYAQKALKLDPKNKYYYLLIAEIYEKQNNYSEALKTYKKLVSEVPKSDEYYYNIAEIYYFQKDYDDALKTYHKIESLFGKSLPLTQRKQEIYLKSNRLNMAIEEGESLARAFPEEPEFRVSHAEFLFKNQMADKAIAILKQVIKDFPDESYARLLLSDIYQAQGDREKSAQELESAFNSPETDLKTKIGIIGGYLRAGATGYNIKKAVELGEATVKTHPDEPQAHVIYAETLMRAGKKEDAWKSFIKASQLDNSSYNLWIQVIGLDADLNKPDSLVVHSEEALEIFPNQALLWLYNGLGYSLKKDYSKAVEVLEEGKKLAGANPDLNLQFNLQLADNYNHVKEFQKSDATFEEIIKADPDNDHALNNYSYFLSLRKEKLELAKTMSEKLVQKHPENPTYLDTHAWVLYQMKNYEEARKYLEIAVQKSENGTILEHYGDVLFRLGKTDAAVEQWKKAKEAGETSEAIDKKIADKKLYE